MASRQRDCYIGIIVTSVIASTALGLRLYARRLMGLRLALDDYLCIVAYAFAVLSSGAMLEWTQYGLGLFLRDIPRPNEVIIRDSLLRLWILEFTYSYSLSFSKFSVLALYWRFFGLFKVRIPIIMLAVSTTIWLLCRTFLGLFHCFPPQDFWLQPPGAVCPIDDAKLELGTVIVHTFLDIAILTMPIFGLRELTFRTVSERIATLATFLSGAFVCFASIITVTQLYVFMHAGKDAATEVLWHTAPPALWGTIEVNMAVLAVSLPLMRPVVVNLARALHAYQPRDSTSQVTQHGWLHVDWLRKITTNPSITVITGRRTTLENIELSLHRSSEVRPQSVRRVDSQEVLRDEEGSHGRNDTMPVSGLGP